MLEGQEGPSPSEGTQRIAEQKRTQTYREFGEKSARIMKDVYEGMFGGRTFEELAQESDDSPVRRRLGYKDISHIRKNATLQVPEFEGYGSTSVIQGIVAARYNESKIPFQPEVVARVRARDGNIDEITFKSREEAETALRRAVWLWGREHVVSNYDYPILERAVQQRIWEYGAEKREKNLSTPSGAVEWHIIPETYGIPSSGFKVKP